MWRLLWKKHWKTFPNRDIVLARRFCRLLCRGRIGILKILYWKLNQYWSTLQISNNKWAGITWLWRTWPKRDTGSKHPGKAVPMSHSVLADRYLGRTSKSSPIYPAQPSHCSLLKSSCRVADHSRRTNESEVKREGWFLKYKIGRGIILKIVLFNHILILLYHFSFLSLISIYFEFPTNKLSVVQLESSRIAIS